MFNKLINLFKSKATIEVHKCVNPSDIQMLLNETTSQIASNKIVNKAIGEIENIYFKAYKLTENIDYIGSIEPVLTYKTKKGLIITINVKPRG